MTEAAPTPRLPRKRRMVRDALGAIVYYDRPEDPARVERIKAILHAGAPRASKLLRWLAGGGLAVWLVLWGTSRDGPWGLLNRWMERTWKQQDELTQEIKKIAPAMDRVADTNAELAKRINDVITVKAGDQAGEAVQKAARDRARKAISKPVEPSR